MSEVPLVIPSLKTDRIQLEPFSQSHSAGMLELWSSSEVCQYSGDAEDKLGYPIQLPAKTSQDSDKILDFFIDRQTKGTAFRWAILRRENHQFLGAVGFNSLEQNAEIAYHLIPRFWGQGIMSEACRLAIIWITSLDHVDTVSAFIEPENIRSIQLATTLGFQETDETKEGAIRFSKEIG